MTWLFSLSINHMNQPVGVLGAVMLSWVIESDQRNVVQQNYQIQILQDGHRIYDSGTVDSSQSAHVPVQLEWESMKRYTVRVRVTAGGERTEWLESSFVTALQRAEEWKGRFISAEPEADKGQSYGTMVRKEFTISKPLKEAWLVSTAHGLYHPYINGKRASEDEMSPGWTSYNKRLLYQTYNVIDLLKKGKNALGVTLGAGWYKGMMGYKHTRNNYGTRTAFGGQLILRYKDGTEEWICSDATWKGSKGPVLFSEIYDGEIYDARLEQAGWTCPDFDERHWQPVETVEQDIQKLFPQSGCPVRVMDQFSPAALLTTPEGDTVIDFGQNMTGWCEFTIKNAHPGDVAELQFFETMDGAGNVYTENLRESKQTIRYICKGGKGETYHPQFTFQGFQYAKVVSWPGEVALNQFTACVVYSGMEPTGTFRCSDPLVNQLWHNILWGMKGNFLDIPTDCPQRDERLGWTGDAQVFGRTASFLMNTQPFFSKWLADVAADQAPNGAVPHVVPDILTGNMEGDWLLDQEVQGGASGWGDVAVILPWTLYLTYGDKEILRRQMPSMKAWIRFMKAHSKGCRFAYGAQFGDWLALDAALGSYKGATPEEYTCAAYYCHSAALVSKMLQIISADNEADDCAALAREITADFQRQFFRPDGTLTIQTQTAHVLALCFDLAPAQFHQKTAEGLKALLAQSGGYLATGFLGTPYLAHALSENGGLKEAYDLLMNEDFPGWLYQVKAGATTIWEHWDGKRPDGSMWSADMNSFNHYAYGSIGEWIVRTVAGLELDEARPGYDHFYVKPQIGGGLTEASLIYMSIHGAITIHWKLDSGCVTLTVDIPANTSAEIVLPQAVQIMDSDGLDFSDTQAHAGSGQYIIQYMIQ